MHTITEIENAARRASSSATFESLFGAADDVLGKTTQANVDAWERVDLHPQTMVDVSSRSIATTVLGVEVASPVLLGPIGGSLMYDREGEVASARAALAANTVHCLSMASSRSMRDVRAVGALSWFQLYILKDRNATERIIRNAEETGFSAIVVTVDNSALRSRERDGRIGEMSGASPFPIFEEGGLTGVDFQYYQNCKSLSFTWSDFAWLRSFTTLPVALKGVLRADDARTAVDAGADAIVVSNHGGHALPGLRGTPAALAAVAAAVGESAEVYVDGGIRSGRDVLKALALGARATLIGRPQVWGLAAAGSSGVEAAVGILAEELYTAMGLSGVTDVRSVPRHLAEVRGPDQSIRVNAVECAGVLRRTGVLDDAEYHSICDRLAEL